MMTDSIHSYANEVVRRCKAPPKAPPAPHCLLGNPYPKGASVRPPGNPPGLGLRKDILADLHHEVSSGHKLSNEAGMAGGLETGKQREQEGVPCAAHSLQDPLLTVQAAREDVGWNLPSMGCALTATHLWLAQELRGQVDGSHRSDLKPAKLPQSYL